MVYSLFSEDNHLLTIFHKSLRILVHTVNKNLVIQVLFHFGHIHHPPLGQLLEFVIADLCAVKCDYLVMAVMACSKHERVVGRREHRPTHLRWHVLQNVP